MGMHLGTFVQTPIIRKWSEEITFNLKDVIECQHFADLKRLIEKIIHKDNQCPSPYLVLLEVENDLFSEYVNQLIHHTHNIKVLACGFPKSLEDIKKLFELGIKGYVDVTFSEIEFLKAVKEVKNDNYYLPNGHLNELISGFVTGVAVQMATANAYTHNHTITQSINKGINNQLILTYALTEKEKVVVEYLLKGYSYKQIAELISLTAFAVNQRAKSVFKKCGVRSRNELSYLLLK